MLPLQFAELQVNITHPFLWPKVFNEILIEIIDIVSKKSL